MKHTKRNKKTGRFVANSINLNREGTTMKEYIYSLYNQDKSFRKKVDSAVTAYKAKSGNEYLYKQKNIDTFWSRLYSSDIGHRNFFKSKSQFNKSIDKVLDGLKYTEDEAKVRRAYGNALNKVKAGVYDFNDARKLNKKQLTWTTESIEIERKSNSVTRFIGYSNRFKANQYDVKGSYVLAEFETVTIGFDGKEYSPQNSYRWITVDALNKILG